MTFNVQDREGNQALDENIRANGSAGFSVLSGCDVTIASGDLGPNEDTVTIADGAVFVDGEHYSITETTIGLTNADEFPRWDVIYVNSAGEILVAEGDEEPRDPPDAERTAVKRPAPPDLSDTDATVLASIWISASDTFIGYDDIISRRSDGDHVLHRSRALGVLQQQTLPEGDTLHVPVNHTMSVTPPYTIEGTLELDGTLDLR